MAGSVIKNAPSGDAGSMGQEDPLEKETTTQSSILAWEMTWTEEPRGLQSIGHRRVRNKLSDWTTANDDTLHLFIRFLYQQSKIPGNRGFAFLFIWFLCVSFLPATFVNGWMNTSFQGCLCYFTLVLKSHVNVQLDLQGPSIVQNLWIWGMKDWGKYNPALNVEWQSCLSLFIYLFFLVFFFKLPLFKVPFI